MPSGPQRAGDSASPAFGGRVNGPLRYGLSPQGGRRRRDASPVTREGDIGHGPYLSERTDYSVKQGGTAKVVSLVPTWG